jgi:PEP-CTERM motif
MRKTLFVFAFAVVVPLASAQTIDPFFASDYSYTDIGTIDGVPSNFGGLTLLAGNPNKLLIGGSANTLGGGLYTVDVVRDINGHITGFSGTASLFGSAPYNDGGITYGPGGVLFASQWPVNMLGQYLPGSTSPDKTIDLAPFGVASSHSAIAFAPSDRSYAGRMKLTSWSGGQFYDALYTPDGLGTFDIVSVTQTETLVGGPEGFAYIPLGSTLFGDSMIVSEYSAGIVSTYDVDANGDPIGASRKVFMTGLSGAEGAYIDPLTGDFLFSTFGGGSRVIVVQGFQAPVPEPASFAVLGLGALALIKRRRRV